MAIVESCCLQKRPLHTETPCSRPCRQVAPACTYKSQCWKNFVATLEASANPLWKTSGKGQHAGILTDSLSCPLYSPVPPVFRWWSRLPLLLWLEAVLALHWLTAWDMVLIGRAWLEAILALHWSTSWDMVLMECPWRVEALSLLVFRDLWCDGVLSYSAITHLCSPRFMALSFQVFTPVNFGLEAILYVTGTSRALLRQRVV